MPASPAGCLHLPLRVSRHVLTRRAIAADVDAHRVFMIIKPALRDFRGKLVKIPLLNLRQAVGNCMELGVVRRILAGLTSGMPGVPICALERRTVTLTGKTPEINTGVSSARWHCRPLRCRGDVDRSFYRLTARCSLQDSHTIRFRTYHTDRFYVRFSNKQD